MIISSYVLVFFPPWIKRYLSFLIFGEVIDFMLNWLSSWFWSNLDLMPFLMDLSFSPNCYLLSSLIRRSCNRWIFSWFSYNIGSWLQIFMYVYIYTLWRLYGLVIYYWICTTVLFTWPGRGYSQSLIFVYSLWI